MTTMEIVVNSRQTKASDVLDMAFDLALDRPKIVGVEDWDGSPAYLLTFGPLAYRKTAILRPFMSSEQVKQILLLAKAEEAAKVAKEIEPVAPVVDMGIPISAAKPQKRKAAKSRVQR